MIHDATFTSPGFGESIRVVNGLPIGVAGLWISRSGSWAVAGSTLVGLPAGSSRGYLARPATEPFPAGYRGNALGHTRPAWGSSQAIVALTPPGGWGSTAAAWGLALNLSPSNSRSITSHYLMEARSPAVSVQPGTLNISKVDGGSSTILASVAWAADATHDYDLVFQSYCECAGRPVYLFATVIDRSAPPPNMSDSNHDLAYGGAGVVSLYATDSPPGLSAGLTGPPALVALPGTDGASFTRVQLFNDAPARTLRGFGPRMIGYGSYAPRVSDGAIVAGDPYSAVFPI